MLSKREEGKTASKSVILGEQSRKSSSWPDTLSRGRNSGVAMHSALIVFGGSKIYLFFFLPKTGIFLSRLLLPYYGSGIKTNYYNYQHTIFHLVICGASEFPDAF